MERGILTQEYRHEPVMLGEVLESLQLKSGSVVCDCTLGGAGHSVKMAAQVGETGLLLGVDQDDMALEAAGARLDREVPAPAAEGQLRRLGRAALLGRGARGRWLPVRLGRFVAATRYPWQGLFVQRGRPIGHADGSG